MNLISSLRGCQGLYMRTGDSFNIFTEDICITEQEIVLWEKRQEKNVTNFSTKVWTESEETAPHLVIQNDFSPTVLW